MDSSYERFHLQSAAAWIRGHALRTGVPTLDVELLEMPLEVLEHIPQVEQAVAAAVAMARKYVVVSVPSKEDDNPEHIHLLTKDILTELFAAAGCTRLHFDGVNGHLILFAAK